MNKQQLYNHANILKKRLKLRIEKLEQVYQLGVWGMNEIETFLQELTEYWNDNELVEIRLTPCKNKNSYDVIKEISNQYGIYRNKKSSLFFTRKQFHIIPLLLSARDGLIMKHEKVCYSVNPRVKDNKGEIETSGLQSISNIRTIVFDVEEKEKSEYSLNIRRQQFLDEYCDFLENALKREGLTTPIRVDSGCGRHLIYRIVPVKVTRGRIDWTRAFIERCIKQYSNSMFHIDSGVKDISRVLGLPGSINHKWQRQVKVLKQCSLENKFTIKTLKKPKITTIQKVELEYKKLSDTLEWKIFTRNPPEGETNNIIVFAIKLFLKAHGNIDYTVVEKEASRVWKEHWNINPNQGTEGKTYNKGIIIGWCNRHIDWVKQHKDIYQQYLEYKG